MNKAKAIMVVGTSSFAGKSLLTAAFCRIFKNKGYRVAPFKAQNMSLNSVVTNGGREISRAQAVQAFAAGAELRSDMNPLLLKPKGNGITQIVLNGMPFKDISAKDYYASFVKEIGEPRVKEAYERLANEYEIIVMEGAGSPAEINLYEKDIANLSAAEMADADVVLVADIERGGVFASILGTFELLSPVHRKRIKGIIINKFRGDKLLLDPGIEEIQGLVGVPVIGVLPFIEDVMLPEEDSQSLSQKMNGLADIAIIRLPRISNFTDFDPLAFDKRINLRYVSSASELGNPDAIIIPGTKSTIDDLNWIKDKGLDTIKEFNGKIPIIGICGGYQILGKKIVDKGVEKDFDSEYEGLDLLPVETFFEAYQKITKPVTAKVIADKGVFNGVSGSEISGYEIHMGKTNLLKGAKPVFKINGEREGAGDSKFMTFGTYLHGLFDSPYFRENFVNFVLGNHINKPNLSGIEVTALWEESIVRIVGVVERHVDLSWFYD
jgi:adenosylcobyric acid synthase